MLFYIVYLSAQAAGNIWLSEWSNDASTVNGSQDLALRNLRLSVYGSIGVVQGGMSAHFWITPLLVFFIYLFIFIFDSDGELTVCKYGWTVISPLLPE